MNRLPIALLLACAAVLAEDEAAKIQKTASGLAYEVLEKGKGGDRPVPGDKVKVHYTGTFLSGKKFDSSRDRGTPFEFMLGAGAVIDGWDEGIALMHVGSRFKFTIPWTLAYGANGKPPGIPPKADLIFDVELLGFTKGRPLPAFAALDPDKLVELESGLKYEVLADGAGDVPAADQIIKLRFMIWNTKGQVLACSDGMGRPLSGPRNKLRLTRVGEKFLAEAAGLLKVGSKLRFEVPPGLCWGATAIHPTKMPANSVSIWYLELEGVAVVPKFRKSDPEKLKKTASGLQYEVIREGEGTSPGATDTVEVHYTGWLENGTMFDSSHSRGQTTSFPLNRVISGWTEGLQLMKPGASYQFTISGNLAYGASPPPGSGIPPNATLIFLVELVRVK